MEDSLLIKPIRKPLSHKIVLPGSKSITNRALLLAACCDQFITLQNALFSDDTRIMIRALETLGFSIKIDTSKLNIHITGQGGKIPRNTGDLFIGNAGTAARFLTAFLSTTTDSKYTLDGTPAMRQRPMKGLIKALEQQGTKFYFHENPYHFPFTMECHGLRGGYIEVDASTSSQILSALLMIAPLAQSHTQIKLLGKTVSEPFVAMTQKMMHQFGIVCRANSERKSSASSNTLSDDLLFEFESNTHSSKNLEYKAKYKLKENTYIIEPDATAASYFLVLPFLVGGSLQISYLESIALQGDIAFRKLLPLNRDRGFSHNFCSISDTFLTLAALTPLFASDCTLSGIGHTRYQECDRLLAVAQELVKLGQTIKPSIAEIEKDKAISAFTVTPHLANLKAKTKASPLSIETYHDHRIAMSFSILGSFDLHGNGQVWIQIENPGCCEKTFPRFFDILNSLH